MIELRAGVTDSTLPFLLRGYRFIGERCDRAGADVAMTRLLLRPTVLLRGRRAARMLYDDELFERRGALPLRGQRTLTGRGGVQGLDGTAHRGRKSLFVRLLDDAAAARLAELFVAELRRRLPRWERAGSIRLLDECSEALCVAAGDWLGLPAADSAVRTRTRELRAMIESGARLGPRHWQGLLARRTAERALAGHVRRLREEGALGDSPVEIVARHADADGCLLPERIAAVELLNLLRPIVAIARYVTFAVFAASACGLTTELQNGDDRLWRSFAHEVRRFYPFFPAIAAVASRDVEFDGRRIQAGTRVLLDIWGTNRHPEAADPDRFRADRYLAEPGPFDLIPQGGGEVSTGHRCPGEGVTLAVMCAALRVLLGEISYSFAGPVAVPLRPIPTAPSDGLRLTDIRISSGRV